jgi:hypothetical protein
VHESYVNLHFPITEDIHVNQIADRYRGPRVLSAVAPQFGFHWTLIDPSGFPLTVEDRMSNQQCTAVSIRTSPKQP